MKTVRIGVIGAGHLGNFHCQKFTAIEDADLKVICDTDREKAQAKATEYGCLGVSDYKGLVDQVDAVLIASPTPSHFEVARFFLENKKHVLLEKPITETVAQAESLCEIADQNQLILQVGHVERFNPALLSAREQLKEPLFMECHRLAPFKPRSVDVDVVLDLMIHDLDVIMSLTSSPVVSVSAVGTPVITRYVDIANARLEFESGAVANITSSRVSQSSKRKFRVFQESQYLSIDFGSGELNLTTKTGEWENFEEDMPLSFEAWELEKGDALMAEDQSFIDCIRQNRPPVVSGRDALVSLKVAEQIRDDIQKRLDQR